MEANLALKDKFSCEIHGPYDEAVAIPGLDRSQADGDEFEFAGRRVQVIATPGHTAGHICYYLPDDGLLFAADTLFAMGCGRLFEGTAAQMFANMQRFKALPGDTIVYCAHEYTESNGRFALTVEPDNVALQARMADVVAARAHGEPTVPTTIAQERDTNIFMRAQDVAQLAERRAGKDAF